MRTTRQRIIAVALAAAAGVTGISAAATPGRYGAAELTDTLGDKNIVTEIAFFTDRIVNVRHYVTGTEVDKRDLVVTLQKQDVSVSRTDDEASITLSSGSTTVVYDRATGCVTFLDGHGQQMIAERGTAALTQVKDGPFDSYRVGQTFTLESGERIYGLGQLQNGNWNQRSRTYNYMIEGNTSVWIPYIHSQKGYAIYWDNPSPTTFRDNTTTGMTFESAAGYGVDYFYLAGSPADGNETVSQMRRLTGSVPLAPLWAYGFFQSKERYESADETMCVVRRYRELGVPLDCVVQDWQYWGNNNMWNAMEFANPKFANYQEMIDSVHRMDAHLLISVWANFGPDTKPYAHFKENNQLMKQGDKIMTDTYPSNEGVAIYDTYSADARDAYWRFFYDGVVSKGVDAYWMDSSEPDHYQGGDVMEETFDFVTGMGCTWRSVRNAFPLVHVGGVYDHHRAEPSLSGKRAMILTRSAYAGQQRYGANTWSGDITASWQTLKNQITAALSFTLCGNPNWNSDTGAFFNGDLGGPGNDEYNELYARWLQFSTFCPMMRSHGAGTDKAIYVWGKRGTPYFDNEEKYIGLRYSLLPYIYSTAWDVHHNGRSFMNALVQEFPEDADAATVSDEYLFGRSLLVAPVLSYGAKERSVRLPAGAQWTDFWTGETTDGGSTVAKAVDLSTLPLYVRAGSIVPWARPAMHADISRWDTLQVRIYPGADGSFTLYEDEGDSYNYENGLCSTITMTWDDAARRLTVGPRNGTYEGMTVRRVFDVVVVGDAMGTGTGLSREVNARVEYDGSEVSLVIDTDNKLAVEYVDDDSKAEAADREFDLADFDPTIKGNGTFSDGTFSTSTNNFGGWWDDYGYIVNDHRYLVAELDAPADTTCSFRVYTKSNYASSPLAFRLSEGVTTAAIDLGDASFVYGVGFRSRLRKTINIRRVYATNTLPANADTDAARPYRFTASDWVTGDAGRVNQKNISYDKEQNTITVNATGDQNTCLQLNVTKSDAYCFDRRKTWMRVKCSGVSTRKDDSQMWYFNGCHLGSLSATKTMKAADGDIIVAWDISTWLPSQEQVHLCAADQFIICFGMTSTDGTAVISDISFCAEDEIGNVETGVKGVTVNGLYDGFGDPCYDLSGRKQADLSHAGKGIYISNGKKIIKK